MKCSSNKKVFASYPLAVDALIEAWTRFDYPGKAGPRAVYQCEDCGYFHLTSQGEMDPTLAKHLGEGKIALQKEADHWLRKLKK